MCAHGSVPRPTGERRMVSGSIQKAVPTMRKARAMAAPAPILNGRRLMSVTAGAHGVLGMLDLLSACRGSGQASVLDLSGPGYQVVTTTRPLAPAPPAPEGKVPLRLAPPPPPPAP